MKVVALARTACQTNEQFDLAVVRSGRDDLPAGDLLLDVVGDDVSRARLTFLVPAVCAKNEAARRTEHLHLDGRLLRPGRSTYEFAVGGAQASTSQRSQGLWASSNPGTTSAG